jgi:hypothetical protein
LNRTQQVGWPGLVDGSLVDGRLLDRWLLDCWLGCWQDGWVLERWLLGDLLLVLADRLVEDGLLDGHRGHHRGFYTPGTIHRPVCRYQHRAKQIGAVVIVDHAVVDLAVVVVQPAVLEGPDPLCQESVI